MLFFTQAKPLLFSVSSVESLTVNICKLGPALSSLHVSHTPQYLTHNKAGAVVNCETSAVQTKLLSEVRTAKEPQTGFTETHIRTRTLMPTGLSEATRTHTVRTQSAHARWCFTATRRYHADSQRLL